MSNYRHGDLVLISVKSIPKNLKISESKEIIRGSNNNPHLFDNGIFYKYEKDNLVGYLKAEDTKLYHKDHGIKIKNKELREVEIEDGNYKLLRQVEFTNEGMRIVED